MTLKTIMFDMYSKALHNPSLVMRKTLSRGLVIFLRYDKPDMHMAVLRVNSTASMREYSTIMANLPYGVNGANPIGYDHPPYHGFKVIWRVTDEQRMD